MFEIKKSYEEFKQDEKNKIKEYREIGADQWVTPMASIGTYKTKSQNTFPVLAYTIDGKDVPKEFGGPMNGKAIEFFLGGLIGCCADSEEAYNEFAKKINGKMLYEYSPVLKTRVI